MLSSVRVLDLAGEALTYAGRMFADLGADVVLVEPPGGGAARRVPPLLSTATGDIVSAHFAYMAAGKRSITIALSSPAGRTLFRQLVERFDVVLTTEPVGGLERLGLGYDDLRAVNPGLVLTSVTPFGRSGPRRRWVGSDAIGWASSGVLPSVGDPDRAPLIPARGLADMASALVAAVGTMVALRARRRTGKGQLVDISQQEAVLSVGMEASPAMVMDTGVHQARTGRRRSTPPMGHYPTRDGAVAIVAYTPWQWDALAQWISEVTGQQQVTLDVFGGTPASRAPYIDLIDQWVENLTSRYTKQEFAQEAQRRGIPATPVNSPADLFDDPHIRATNGWVEKDSPIGWLSYPTPPLRFDGNGLPVGAVPGPGADNRAVFVDDLGLTDDDLSMLRARGAT